MTLPVKIITLLFENPKESGAYKRELFHRIAIPHLPEVVKSAPHHVRSHLIELQTTALRIVRKQLNGRIM
jgi:hypothetical protein